MTSALLEIDQLATQFFAGDGVVHAVDGVSYSVAAGETVAVVGESGCGKSAMALSILGLIAPSTGRVVAGRILFRGEDLLKRTLPQLRAVRGKEISMIFQEPMTSLNPVLSVGFQLVETLRQHERLTAAAARERAIELLRLVHMADPERRMDEYPHQLSGGMRQRVMIAMAVACSPQLLIADEPTTALDVTVQAQILDLMRELRRRTGTAIILITHDLGVVAEMAERVIVLYAGKKVEEAPVDALFAAPRHPYTRGLLASVPRLGASLQQERRRLAEIPGMVPRLSSRLLGCSFAQRCPCAAERCRQSVPELQTVAPGHLVACFEAERMVMS